MTLLAPLAVMVHERPPLTGDDLPAMLVSWLQDAGGFAAMGLALWSIAYLLCPAIAAAEEQWPAWKKKLFVSLAAAAGLGYVVFGLLWFVARLAPSVSSPASRETMLTVAGSLALLAVALPFAWDLAYVRLGRIWAIAYHLTFWEAIRNRVLGILFLIVPLFMFGDWVLSHQPQNQLRTTVVIEYFGMAVLVLVTGVILAAFGIPNDIRHQSIHTVVVKPVQRFEIVAGRLLGYVLLMSVILFGLTLVSLLYLAVPGRLHPAAIRETWRARVPIYGDLEFRGRIPGMAGINVGREWDYRRYIPGGTGAEAAWAFKELPGQLDVRASVPCEFSFEIFRIRKGEEGKGVTCTLTFRTWRWSPARQVEYLEELARVLNEEKARPKPASEMEIHNRLAEKYGFYQIRSKEVFDYQIFTVDVPAGLFKNARGPDKARFEDLQISQQKVPPVEVSVTCDQPTQFLGMARHDLYLVDAEGYFAVNFFKGVLGIWFRLCLITGLAVACSTYLSGVVSLITALFLYGAGWAREFIQNVAANAIDGGGPMEQALRLVKRMNLTAPMDPSPTAQTATVFDEMFRWFIRRLLNLVPDVERFDLSLYVSEGFDVSLTSLAMCFVLLVGYLLPWTVLAHYLIKSREVAS